MQTVSQNLSGAKDELGLSGVGKQATFDLGEKFQDKNKGWHFTPISKGMGKKRRNTGCFGPFEGQFDQCEEHREKESGHEKTGSLEKEMEPNFEGPRSLDFILRKEQSLKTQFLEQQRQKERRV